MGRKIVRTFGLGALMVVFDVLNAMVNEGMIAKTFRMPLLLVGFIVSPLVVVFAIDLFIAWYKNKKGETRA